MRLKEVQDSESRGGSLEHRCCHYELETRPGPVTAWPLRALTPCGFMFPQKKRWRCNTGTQSSFPHPQALTLRPSPQALTLWPSPQGLTLRASLSGLHIQTLNVRALV